jgi:DNA-directed RNA polymerase subunit RPC12/RpoP
MFYERDQLFTLKNGPINIEYSGYECASCGGLMIFKTRETAGGIS